MSCRNILFMSEALFGPRFWTPFFRALGRRVPVRLHCVAPHRALANDYARAGLFETITCLEDELARYMAFDKGLDPEVMAMARAFEARYGERLADIIQADRHFGRGSFFLGHHHPRSVWSDAADLGRSIRYIVHVAGILDALFREHAIDTLVMVGVASTFPKLLCVVARRNGARIRMFNSARTGALFTWYHDEYYDHPPVRRRFDAMRRALEPSAWEAATPDQVEVDKTANAIKGAMLEGTRLAGMARRVGQQIYLRARSELADFVKRRPRHPNRYHLSSNIAYLWRFRSHFRLWQKLAQDMETVAGIKYVYFPLHVEPELASMVLSPEFNNQVAIIDLVSKSLPGDMVLVVKEHMVALGRRPRAFYEWLSDMQNVVMARADADGPAIARGASAVVTLTGTAGLEAATEGVPVLTFGRHNLYDVMRHVHVVDRMSELRALLDRIAAPRPQEEQARAIAEGRLFIEALAAESMDTGDEVFENGDPARPVSDEIAGRAADLFLRSLSHGDGVEAQPGMAAEGTAS